MHQFLPYSWFQGQCVPFEEARISIATHALHYGTGAFGGMRAIPDPQNSGSMLLFRADRHARRLSQSARLLLTDLSEARILEALTAMLQANKPQQPIYLRPFVYTSDLGIAPRLHDIETDFLIYGLLLVTTCHQRALVAASAAGPVRRIAPCLCAERSPGLTSLVHWPRPKRWRVVLTRHFC